jgi:hypothetical protein
MNLDEIKQYARGLLAHSCCLEPLERRVLVAKCIDDAIDQRKWEDALLWLRGPYRLAFFYVIQSELDEAEYGRLLRDVWQDAERPWRYLSEWIQLFTNPRLRREFLMIPEDLAFYNALPESVTIWRGCAAPRHARSISWTTDPDQAAWFAQRFSDKGGRIYSIAVNREAIIAYFSDRSESEVIIDPRKLGPLRAAPWTEAEIRVAADRRSQRMRESAVAHS